MSQKNKVILLAGPTGSGKSKLAIEIAKHINGEIINADSMQIYKEISILTSKPSIKDMSTVKHHLYGFNSVRKKFSSGHWLRMVIEKIKKLWRIKKTPIVVGGTGLYFKALTDGLVKIPDIPGKISTKTRTLQKKIGQKKFFAHLTKLDPKVRKFIIPTDVQRSIRAYEVKKFTNISLFDFIKKTKPNFEQKIFRKLFINIPKEHLKQKIEQRVEMMFNSGAVDEVQNFIKMKVNKKLSANKIIGIKEINDYLNGKMTLNATKELIKQKTRQYSKRQFTWARGHMKSWDMIYSANINDLIKKTINKIS